MLFISIMVTERGIFKKERRDYGEKREEGRMYVEVVEGTNSVLIHHNRKPTDNS